MKEIEDENLNEYHKNLKEQLIEQNSISIENISFSYSDKPIFQSVNININFNKLQQFMVNQVMEKQL